MDLEPHKITFNIRIFEHIVTGKRFKGRHAEKLEIEVHRPEQIVHAPPVNKFLIRIVPISRFRIGGGPGLVEFLHVDLTVLLHQLDEIGIVLLIH